MRTRAFRRHQTQRHLQRRLSEDRNQHYENLTCPCWTNPRAMARFKEQPKQCQHHMCANQRHAFGRNEPTLQERRFFCIPDDLD